MQTKTISPVHCHTYCGNFPLHFDADRLGKNRLAGLPKIRGRRTASRAHVRDYATSPQLQEGHVVDGRLIFTAGGLIRRIEIGRSPCSGRHDYSAFRHAAGLDQMQEHFLVVESISRFPLGAVMVMEMFVSFSRTRIITSFNFRHGFFPCKKHSWLNRNEPAFRQLGVHQSART